ncbi:UNVERIFIED_CONTAM: hypothetical protein FKN15_015709 [Acipenser sinensis]
MWAQAVGDRQSPAVAGENRDLRAYYDDSSHYPNSERWQRGDSVGQDCAPGVASDGILLSCAVTKTPCTCARLAGASIVQTVNASGKSRTTVSRVFKEWRTTEKTGTDRSKCGRKRLLTDRERQWLEKIVSTERTQSSRVITETLNLASEQPVSARTVRRELQRMGFYSPVPPPLLKYNQDGGSDEEYPGEVKDREEEEGDEGLEGEKEDEDEVEEVEEEDEDDDDDDDEEEEEQPLPAAAHPSKRRGNEQLLCSGVVVSGSAPQSADCKSHEYEHNGYCCNKCLPGFKMSSECPGPNMTTSCMPCAEKTFLAISNYNKNCFRCRNCEKRFKMSSECPGPNMTTSCMPCAEKTFLAISNYNKNCFRCRNCEKRPEFLYAVVSAVPVNRWKEFVRRLGLSDREMEYVERDQRCFQEAQYEMMRLWRNKKGTPQQGAITGVLRGMGLEGCAEELSAELKWQA